MLAIVLWGENNHKNCVVDHETNQSKALHQSFKDQVIDNTFAARIDFCFFLIFDYLNRDHGFICSTMSTPVANYLSLFFLPPSLSLSLSLSLSHLIQSLFLSLSFSCVGCLTRNSSTRTSISSITDQRSHSLSFSLSFKNYFKYCRRCHSAFSNTKSSKA